MQTKFLPEKDIDLLTVIDRKIHKTYQRVIGKRSEKLKKKSRVN